MKIIGLSGGIASGKNYISDIFSEFKAQIFDADKVAHNILQNDQEIIDKIAKYYPQALINNKIDRKILGSIILNSENKLKIIEDIIHPQVRKKYLEFVKNCKNNNSKFLILNIPLLIEKKFYQYDYLIAIIVDEKLRQERYINRELEKLKESDKTESKKIELRQKFNNIKSRQLSDKIRIEKAHFILDGALEYKELRQRIKDIIAKIEADI